jgi:hypothetical protein
MLACVVLACGSAQAQNTWTGSAGTTNWSTPGNWSLATAPVAADTVVFDNTTTPFAPAGVVDNIVDANFTIAALQYGTVSTNGYHASFINPGLSLNVNGVGGNPIFVGRPDSLSGATVYERFLGPGTLTATNTTGAIQIVQPGANNDHAATLDLSGLTNFSANVDQLLVGAMTFVTSGINRPMGVMLMAETNYLQTSVGTTKPGILVAAYPGSDTNVRGTQQLFLGRHNIFNADVISVGGHKSTGQILFRSGLIGGLAIMRGSAGGTDRVKLPSALTLFLSKIGES